MYCIYTTVGTFLCINCIINSYIKINISNILLNLSEFYLYKVSFIYFSLFFLLYLLGALTPGLAEHPSYPLVYPQHSLTLLYRKIVT